MFYNFFITFEYFTGLSPVNRTLGDFQEKLEIFP
jgi:hypothetical protein